MLSLTSSRLSREVMSNQPGILKPRLRVMGMTGAVGQMTLRWSGLMVLSRLAQPCPVSPSPCRKIMEAVCLIRGLRITGFREDLIMVSVWLELFTEEQIYP